MQTRRDSDLINSGLYRLLLLIFTIFVSSILLGEAGESSQLCVHILK